jgi:hypothetical protein
MKYPESGNCNSGSVMKISAICTLMLKLQRSVYMFDSFSVVHHVQTNPYIYHLSVVIIGPSIQLHIGI